LFFSGSVYGCFVFFNLRRWGCWQQEIFIRREKRWKLEANALHLAKESFQT